MIISSDKQINILMTGLPRSGTTIITRFFNQPDNSYCVSEPYLCLMKRKKVRIIEKLKPFFNKDIFSLEELDNYVSLKNNFILSGSKETFLFSPINTINHIKEQINSKDILLIVVLRNPVHTFSSIKKKSESLPISSFHYYSDDVNRYIDRYNELLSLSNKLIKFIIYENFIKNPIEYINNKFKNLFSISLKGDLILDNDVGDFGDISARKSSNIISKEIDINNLKEREITLIENSKSYKFYMENING